MEDAAMRENSGVTSLRGFEVGEGPRALLASYLALAERNARAAGLRLVFHSNFENLIELNRTHKDVWPPIPPIFDPRHSAINAASAVWLQGLDDHGETVVTHAVRLFDLPGTLDDELRSLRVFYADPAPHLAAGERFEVMGDSAKHITGRTVHGGAFWVHPRRRHEGLASAIPRITRAYAYARWKPEFIWGFVEQRMHFGGLTRAYGPYRSTDTIICDIDWRRGTVIWLVWMTGDDMLDDIAELVGHETSESSRLSEMPMTTVSPLARRHGSRRRS
jgi:hypothetical protein